MSVSLDWKPERAVQAKIRDKKNTIILIGWNPKRAIYAKVKDHDEVTASAKHDPLGASNYQKTFDSKHLQIKDSEQGQFKVVRENSSCCVQCIFPIYLPFSKKIQKICGATLLAGYHPIHPVWACAHLFGTLIHSICMISSVFYGNTWGENFQNTKPFLHSLKSVNNKHTFFELMSIWSVHQIRFENGYIPEEKHG